ncbi:hypothetical protein AVEN_275570-1 [Araneus ventricosus]|uniref:Uncharacterized protein n=1 Tax=Araneus ventricosus TaxID=182803 RepID=A0A4Y2TKT5_ARAVE|nr:hypothetical protein AVEN_275570-1 [Araneus ventricosus]
MARNSAANGRTRRRQQTAITECTNFVIKKPTKSPKRILQQEILQNWKKEWDEADTGRLMHETIPTPSLKNHNWARSEVMFFTEHDPFTTCHKRFKLCASHQCSCVETGSSLHFATSRPHTKKWHFSKSSANNLIKWKNAILSNKRSRIRLNHIMDFLMDNDELIKGSSSY